MSFIRKSPLTSRASWITTVDDRRWVSSGDDEDICRRHVRNRRALYFLTARNQTTQHETSVKKVFPVKVLETGRLILRWLSVEDAEFILRLLNEQSFVRFIGDKGVRSIDDARDYILRGPSTAMNGLVLGFT